MSLLRGIQQRTGMTVLEVESILNTASRRYKVYEIEKKSGGSRLIAQPAREVKRIQYAIIDAALSRLDVHSAAAAYVRGIGVLENARQHAGLKAILKMDFENFFNSITARDYSHFLSELDKPFTNSDIDMIIRGCFWQPRASTQRVLSVGAPSSPVISNTLLVDLDRQLSQLASASGAIYTRYADDLTFSHESAGALWKLEGEVRAVVASQAGYKPRINQAKTKVFSPKTRRVVTGVTLTNAGGTSVGRERKREIQAGCHAFLLGRLDEKAIQKLAGWVAFAGQLEPVFLEHLDKKYRVDVVAQLRKRVGLIEKEGRARAIKIAV